MEESVKYPTRFKPGQSGNPKGRPKGARARISEAFLHELQEDFDAHGVEAIKSVRLEKPDVYLKVIASLVPRQFDIAKADPYEDATDEQLMAQIAVLDRKIRQMVNGSGTAGSDDTL